MRTINTAPSTVGEILYEEFLKPLDMPPARLAELMDTSYEKILEIIKNERNITLEEAFQLAIIFNTDAYFWVKLQELHKAWFNKKSVTNGAIVIHTQRLKSDPGGNLLS
ncbi:HigA family addiction module antitoxin [Escherichia coli]|nr:HigA family addiction module antitoxin [Escherichia coli]MCR8888161.1 HigA family addiction module antitoxin [Escherichia coli]